MPSHPAVAEAGRALRERQFNVPSRKAIVRKSPRRTRAVVQSEQQKSAACYPTLPAKRKNLEEPIANSRHSISQTAEALPPTNPPPAPTFKRQKLCAPATSLETDAVFRQILENKATRYEELGMADPRVVTSTTTKPSKASVEWMNQMLLPRGILIQHANDPDELERLFVSLDSPTDSMLQEKLGGAYVEFETNELMEDVHAAFEAEISEAEWEVSVYQKYFLKSNRCSQSGIRRLVKPRYRWIGVAQEISLPPAIIHNRQVSGFMPSSKVYGLDMANFSNTDSTMKDNSFLPDHHYVYVPNEPIEILDSIDNIPAFRAGLHQQGKIISMPPYLVHESKDSANKKTEAEQYVALLAAGLLHERLLLRYLFDDAQSGTHITIEDSPCVYAMTSCGSLSTIYKMIIRRPETSLLSGPIRYDLVQQCSLRLQSKDHCQKLKRWLNLIHYYSLIKHRAAVMTDGNLACKSRLVRNGQWERGLEKIAFHYQKEGLSFKKHRMGPASSEMQIDAVGNDKDLSPVPERQDEEDNPNDHSGMTVIRNIESEREPEAARLMQSNAHAKSSASALHVHPQHPSFLHLHPNLDPSQTTAKARKQSTCGICGKPGHKRNNRDFHP